MSEPIAITLSDFDVHGGSAVGHDDIGWKVRVAHPGGALEGALFLAIPRGRTDLADAVEKQIESTSSVERLRADNARLRGLVKAAEASGDSCCPWCGEYRGVVGGSSEADAHADSCPAFTPEGEVR